MREFLVRQVGLDAADRGAIAARSSAEQLA